MLINAAGTYRIAADSAVLGEAGTGTEYVAVECRVLEGDQAGRVLTWYGYFTEGTSARTIESLRHLGWKGGDLSDLSTVGNAEADLVVEEETYEGKKRMKAQWVNASGGRGAALKNPMTPDKAKAFAAKMRGIVAGVDAAAGSKPAARPVGKAPPPGRVVERTSSEAARAAAGAQLPASDHPNAPGNDSGAPIDPDIGL